MFIERLKRFFRREAVLVSESWILALRKMEEINGEFWLEGIMNTISRKEGPFVCTSRIIDDPNAVYRVMRWNRYVVEGKFFSNGVRIVTTAAGGVYVQCTTEGGWRNVQDFPVYRERLNKRNELLFTEGSPVDNLRNEPMGFLLMQARDFSTLYLETGNLAEQAPYPQDIFSTARG